MSYISSNGKYDMDTALDDLGIKKLILDVKVETQVVLQLLVKKGIVDRNEVQSMRNQVKSSPNYKVMYDYINHLEQQAQYFKDHPEEHLKAVLQAKMNGDLK